MPADDVRAPREGLSEIARQVEAYSIERWGRDRATRLIGRSPAFLDALERVTRYAPSNATVLLCGETGTGKELFARAVHLLSPRRAAAWVTANCAQYQDGALSVSELFGHRRGSFTGAVADQRGVFEASDGGVLFLDEVGELPPAAQALLLRTLCDGEIVPVGESRPRRVDVRLVAATNRDLKALVAAGKFREDLYYRLRCLQIVLPALRDRERDWEMLLDGALATLNAARGTHTRFDPVALAMLDAYPWPGNVREVRALAETGYHECERGVIEPRHIMKALEDAARDVQLQRVPLQTLPPDAPSPVARRTGSFWNEVHEPFLARDLNRSEVQAILAAALARSGGSYKRALHLLGLAPGDYLRFMDFLRHHRLKPAGFTHPRGKLDDAADAGRIRRTRSARDGDALPPASR
jgi:transcriptional regulator with GAF, ATPase, and Fis domain